MKARPLLWAALALLAFQAWRWLPWSSDDAFISLRYADRLAHGLGLTFNDGERVEGYTNPLWTLCVSGLLRAGLEGVMAMKALGLSCAALAVLLAWRLEERLGIGGWAGLGALWVATHPSVLRYAGSGLESPLAAALLAGAWLALAGAESRGRAPGAAAGLALAGAALTRPETALAFAAACLPLSWRAWRGRLSWRALLPFVLAFAVPLGISAALRASYYGAAVPNTYLVKATGPLAGRLAWGLDFVQGALGSGLNPLLLAGGALAPLVLPAVAGTALSAFLFVAASLGYWAWVGGDRSFEGVRPMAHLAPSLAPWAAAGAVAALRALGKGAPLGGLRVGVAALALALGVGHNLREGQLERARLWSAKAGPGTPGRRLTDFPGHMAMYPEIAAWLGAHAGTGDTLCFDEVGYIPYATALATVDTVGLTDRSLAGIYAEARYASYFERWMAPGAAAEVHRRARDYVLDRRRVTWILYAADGGGLTGHPAMLALKDDERFKGGYAEAARFAWPAGATRFVLFRRRGPP